MKKYTLKTTTPTQVNLKINYEKELNREQLQVVKNADGPCLVLAGAGSGKTRTLVYRVAWLLEHGIHPQNILLVTFTNKASHEMLNRVQILLKHDIKGLWGGTFHHIGNRILRKYADRIGFKRNFVILDQSDSQELIASSLQDLPFGRDKKLFPKTTTVQAMLSFSRNAQLPLNDVIAKQWRKFESFAPHLEYIMQAYEQKKKQANAMDYDDLLLLWLLLLHDHPDVKERFARQFQYILVDEFQDTNRIQANIMYELSSIHNNILVVGDDAQSIYSFRAADVSNILKFHEVFPGAQMFKLESNYRSTPEILSLANESIKHNLRNFKKQLSNKRVSLGTKPGLVPTADNGTQAQFVVQRLLELKDEENKTLQDMAVLFRASHQTLELEVELTKQNIAYIKRGGLKYFEQAHIKDVIAYLKIIINPLDELSWRRVLKLYEGIGDKTASVVWKYIRKENGMHDRVLNNDGVFSSISERAVKSLEKLNNTLSDISQLIITDHSTSNFQLSQALEKIVSTGYQEIVKIKFDDPEDRLEDLEQLSVFALNYPSIEQFLSDIALSEGFRGEARGEQEEDEENDYLILSTIHQAKGLEWLVVFIIGLVEGQFPNSKSEDIEEERRLFYVAITRAKDSLYLTYPVSSYFGLQMGRTFSGPSRFINELPMHTYTRWQVGPSAYEKNEKVIDLEDL